MAEPGEFKIHMDLPGYSGMVTFRPMLFKPERTPIYDELKQQFEIDRLLRKIRRPIEDVHLPE